MLFRFTTMSLVTGLLVLGCEEKERTPGGPSAAMSSCAQSSSNVVRNAGLDATVDGFGPGTWHSEDAIGCPSSGSIRVAARSRTETFAITGGQRYFVGFMARNEDAKTSGCEIEWCRLSTCGLGTALQANTIDAPTGSGWQQASAELMAPAGAVAARFTCGTTGTTLFDRFYISSAAPQF
jgi:hypothetical protein